MARRTVHVQKSKGRKRIASHPARPIQSELPIWLTASGNPETFRLAGSAGANVLTHLLGQSTQELADKIRVYREAWKAAGHTGEGHVTLMVHTFVGESMESVRETVRKPFTNYLRSSIDLIKNDPWAFSTFKPEPMGTGVRAQRTGATRSVMPSLPTHSIAISRRAGYLEHQSIAQNWPASSRSWEWMNWPA